MIRSILILTICLTPAFGQSGVVRSAGQPIPGATVTTTVNGQAFTTVTGLDGRYELTGVPAGSGTVSVQMFGFAETSRQSALGPSVRALDFTLQLVPSPFTQRLATTQSLSANDQQFQSELNATALPGPAAAAATGAAATDTFVVSGSLSQGLAQNAASDAGFDPGLRPDMGSGGAGDSGQAPGFGGNTGGGFAGGGGFGGGGFGGAGGGAGGRGGPGGPGGRGARGGVGGPGGRQFGNRRRPATIHGMFFFTLDNSAVNAKPFAIGGDDLPQPAYAQSRFGVVLGGPLMIPKLVKDPSTFFSLTYFGTRAKNPSAAFTTVPTDAERAGDFSQAVQSTGGGQVSPVQIYNPVTHTPFAGSVIPPSLLNPIASGLLNYIPLPNAPGLVNNFEYDAATVSNTDNLNLRLNRNLTKKDRFAYHLSFQRRDGVTLQPFGFQDPVSGRGFTTDLTWTRNISAHLISSAKVTFNRNRNETTPFFANGTNIAALLGIAGTSSNPLNFGPPNLNFTNYGSLSDANAVLTRNQGQGGAENLIWIRGQHSFTFGLQYQRNDLNTRSDQNGRGTYNFTGLATSAIGTNGQPVQNTGYDLADFLLGLPQSSSIRYGDTSNYFHQNVWSAFVNDDWKVLPSLTLVLGLRYEYFAPLNEENGHLANLDVAPSQVSLLVGSAGQIRPDYNNFAPRLALAWKVPFIKRSTIVRAGYGIYYNGQIYNSFALKLAQQPPFATSSSVNTSLADILTLADGFVSAAPDALTNTNAVDRYFRTPYAQSWNLTIQHELPRGFYVELGYQGTKGTRLDVETIPYETAGSPLGFVFDSSNGNSIYHALTVRASQRFRRGLSMSANYAFAKSVDDSSTFGGAGNTVAQNYLDLSAERGLSSFDRRHSFDMNFVATSQVGSAGSRFAADRLVARLLKDWQLTGSITAQTGTPLTARILGNTAQLAQTGGTGSLRASATGIDLGSGNGFFNPLAFAVPPAGELGDAGRNTIPGPDLFGLNLAFGRSFQVGESRRRLEARVEANNVLNHVSYTNLNTVVNSITYGSAVSASAMRTINLVVRFRF